MVIIAHRGNLNGSNPKEENNPEYIKKALKYFDVEIDIWFYGEELFLGHDKPKYLITTEFMHENRSRLWIHCKNIEAALYFYNWNLNYFWHQSDDISITNYGYLWTYLGKSLTEKSIAVLPEKFPEWDISKACGICTDYPLNYQKNGAHL